MLMQEKCPEERPICSHCVRRGTQCVYADNVLATAQPSPESSSSSSTMLPARSVSVLGFDSLDLTLMHHYTVSTSISLLPTDSARRMWQVDVPAKARDHAVLQHGMLALAAMHLARDAAGRNDHVQVACFRSRGLQHQQLALPIFRSLLARDDGTDQDVIFLFSVILVFYAFASPLSAETRPTLGEILDLFALFRGPKVFWKEYGGGINVPWIDAMFPYETTHLATDLPGEGVYFAELDKLGVDDVCVEGIRRLKFGVRCFWARPGDIKTVAWFPSLISDEFMLRIRQHQPAALAILKAYATTIRLYSTRWWVGPWSSILESAVEEAVEESQVAPLADVGDLLLWDPQNNGCQLHTAPGAANAALRESLNPF